ncbi:hypothetical protein GGQ74_000847 [Desulfobaculum xiamenense]|uniref:Phage tail assembly chaperone-like domain-containing protein n=1 Tax=Desulfobaculum xiamenense TaxID=995050 RepID=A0A846QJE9_9BACT|nr:phage tail assembly chaperone [Desulfobaculum xiamenense]NJB67207.1 hypothetical protein [Desulfobaculum xiamenense]
MIIHHYHPVSGVYLGQGEADESPLEPGVYLIPAHATEAAPPVCAEDEIARWSGEAWTVVPDLRGAAYWTSPRERHEITDIGDTIPEGATIAPPPSEYHAWDGMQWVEDAEARGAQLAATIRAERDRRMREVYDPAAMQLLRHRRAVVASGGDTTDIDAQLTAWDVYASALETIPEQSKFPESVEWPVEPATETATHEV